MRALFGLAGLWLLRGWALCLGVFTLVNLVVARLDGGIDSNLWWLDLRHLPGSTELVAFGLAGLLLVTVALVPAAVVARPRLLVGVRVALALLALSALWDLVIVVGLFLSGQVVWGGGAPFSLAVLWFLVVLAWKLEPLAARARLRDAPAEGPGPLVHAAAAAGAVGSFGLLLPLALAASFGATRYVDEGGAGWPEGARDHAVAVVLGAGVRSDGTPSLALYDRTRTAIELYLERRASWLFLSGGPGPGGQHEVSAMVAMAREAGVPAEACIEDRVGLSTWATAENAAAELEAWDPSRGGPAPARIYAVSHAYHTPRVELAFQRHGLDPRTVPARETRPLMKRHYFLLREVPGFWVYWLRRGLQCF